MHSSAVVDTNGRREPQTDDTLSNEPAYCKQSCCAATEVFGLLLQSCVGRGRVQAILCLLSPASLSLISLSPDHSADPCECQRPEAPPSASSLSRILRPPRRVSGRDADRDDKARDLRPFTTEALLIGRAGLPRRLAAGKGASWRRHLHGHQNTKPAKARSRRLGPAGHAAVFRPQIPALGTGRRMLRWQIKSATSRS